VTTSGRQAVALDRWLTEEPEERPFWADRRNGLPVTTPARTVADVIATGVSEELIGQAVEEALARGQTTRDELLTHAERRGGRVRDALERLMAEPA